MSRMEDMLEDAWAKANTLRMNTHLIRIDPTRALLLDAIKTIPRPNPALAEPEDIAAYQEARDQIFDRLAGTMDRTSTRHQFLLNMVDYAHGGWETLSDQQMIKFTELVDLQIHMTGDPEFESWLGHPHHAPAMI